MQTKQYILYIGIGAILIAVLGSLFWFTPVISTNESVLDEATLATMTDFEKGQYYFNHDEDPAGPYDLKKAREYFTKVILDDPKGNSIVWYQLGRIDFLEGNFNTAIHKFNKQIEYFGDSAPNVYYMIGLTYGYMARLGGDTEDWEKGAEGFKTYITYDPTAPWPRVDLSWIYFSQGKYDEMLPPLEEGLEHSPDNAWLHNMYGLALMNTGDRAGAKEHFQKADELAATLTVLDWGRAYPGNDPAWWGEGLETFRDAIKKNLELVAGE